MRTVSAPTKFAVLMIFATRVGRPLDETQDIVLPAGRPAPPVLKTGNEVALRRGK